jgi:hypothetical protein
MLQGGYLFWPKRGFHQQQEKNHTPKPTHNTWVSDVEGPTGASAYNIATASASKQCLKIYNRKMGERGLSTANYCGSQ